MNVSFVARRDGVLAADPRHHAFLRGSVFGACSLCWGWVDDARHVLPYYAQREEDARVARAAREIELRGPRRADVDRFSFLGGRGRRRRGGRLPADAVDPKVARAGTRVKRVSPAGGDRSVQAATPLDARAPRLAPSSRT